MKTTVAAATLGLLLAFSLSQPVPGQEVRVTGVSQFRLIQLRPLVADSVPVETTRGDGLLRRTDSGALVRCVTGDSFCRLLRSGDPISSVPGSQDLHVSVWGLGQGVRAYAHLRSRATVAGESDLWPRSGDHFDALEAFVELRRPGYRIRGGRLWKSSGLGYYNYDGASVSLGPVEGLRLEAYGGWSLARGLSEPRTSGALEAIESFVPDDRGRIVGLEARYRPSPRWAASALYQREIRGDRKGLFSERVAASAFYRAGQIRAEGAVEFDLAVRDLNEGRLRIEGRVGPEWVVSGHLRRYRPFFELWTIWGAFAPVGFDEVGARAIWTPRGRSLALTGLASKRWYPETSTGLEATPIRSDGWRLALDGSGRLAARWELQGGVLGEVGFGAAKSQERIRILRDLGQGRHLAAGALAFQSLYEFRVDEGTVLGVVLDGGSPLGARARVTGSLALYRHSGSGTEPDLDWSQIRASLRFQWTLGPEPGMETRAGDGS